MVLHIDVCMCPFLVYSSKIELRKYLAVVSILHDFSLFKPLNWRLVICEPVLENHFNNNVLSLFPNTYVTHIHTHTLCMGT